MDDHHPCSVRIQISPCHSSPLHLSKRRKPKYDPNKIGDPHCDAKFVEIVNSFNVQDGLGPAATYDVDATSHCHQVESFVNHALAVAYTPSHKIAQKPFLSEGTLNFIHERNRILRIHRRVSARLKLLNCRIVFNIWKRIASTFFLPIASTLSL